MDIVSSIVFISCPSLRTCSENLDLPSSAYLKSFLCSLNLVLKFLLVLKSVGDNRDHRPREANTDATKICTKSTFSLLELLLDL